MASRVAASIDAVVTVVLNAEQTEAVLFGVDGVVVSGMVGVQVNTQTQSVSRQIEVGFTEMSLFHAEIVTNGAAAKSANRQCIGRAGASERGTASTTGYTDPQAMLATCGRTPR